jgi:hypothetical protein
MIGISTIELEGLTAVVIKSYIFWDVTPCTLLSVKLHAS